ncbi:MAG TPA: hypothetical protein VJL28_00515 [Gemmatimonadaceae bacterium]|nr:hypothetical protein [Gemmatimonadaceae bacterium]
MPFPPDGFHTVADELKRGVIPSGEGRHRTIAGRAYYGLYWATCAAVCRTHGIAPAKNLPHEALSLALAGCKTDAGVRELGNFLNSLRLLRIRSDYRLARTVNKTEADDAVTDARKALDLLPSVEPRLPKVDPAY